LIIGAGAAGLAAARTLADAGQRVAILEARDRIGGRIFTQRTRAAGRDDLLAVELGAEFIHGLPGETWSLVREEGLEAYELYGENLFLSDGRIHAADAAHDAAGDVLRDVGRWVHAHPGRDLTFSDYLRLAKIGTEDAEAACAYVEGFNAADRNIIGIAALVKQQLAEDEIEGDRIFHIRGGYDRLPYALARRLEGTGTPIFLNSPVRRLAWREGEVSIHRDGSAPGREGVLRARRAVITLPLGVLHAGSVEFSPAPGSVLAHARRLRMGTAVRATMVFDARFWRSDMSFLFTPELTPATWWTAMPEPSPMITGWSGGPKAELLQRQPGGNPRSLVTECIHSLSAAFGLPEDALTRRLTSSHTHDWSSDPHAMGAYSYAPVDALDASDRMSLPVADTLYFAGEHTDTTGHWGTVHGALRSGLRAAGQILRRA